MSMATCCPACATTFRVTPLQLQAHDGKVRCGRCAHVFDGFLALTTLPDPASPSSSAQHISPPVILPELAEVAPADELRESPQDAPEIPDVLLASPASAATGFVPEVSLPASAPARRGIWAFASALLFAGLVAQGAYAYRSELAADLPELRTPLDRMCAVVGCVVGLPQQPESIKIEAFDMQAIDTNHPGWLRMTATLRNHATVDLGYPALDVVLTDSNDQLLVRRIFLPAEYLSPKQPVAAGIAANAEVLVQLDLDTGTIAAAGFRPDLRAAPLR
jgi:predicted Zn finger-like uncharacterized protein